MGVRNFVRKIKPESKCINSSLMIYTTWIWLLPESCWPHFRYLEVVGDRYFVHFLLDVEVIFFFLSKLVLYTLTVNRRGKTSFFSLGMVSAETWEHILDFSPTLPEWPLVEWVPAMQAYICYFHSTEYIGLNLGQKLPKIYTWACSDLYYDNLLGRGGALTSSDCFVANTHC